MEKKRIAAVVVTYNRFELLKTCIESLRAQSRVLDRIIVVNNGSTDGTRSWLDSQSDLKVVHQENGGGSFGFHTGIKTAFEMGFDFIWCMDDDVRPRPDCLDVLLKYDSEKVGILCPARIMNGVVYVNEKLEINLKKPFGNHRIMSVSDIKEDAPIAIEGMTFEGPLIKRSVVEKIGYPNKDLFLSYDDTDYSLRAVLEGFKVFYVPAAIMDKEFFQESTKVEFVRKNKWKVWYFIRNGAYIQFKYGKNLPAKYISGLKTALYVFGCILVNYPRNDKYCLSDFVKPFSMYFRGLLGRLGKM